jgi:hypothetical protein
MNQAGVLIAVQMGAELGLPAMASLQNIAVINGRPSVWGDAIPAICMSSGQFDHAAFEEVIERDAKDFPVKATCTVRRLPSGKPVSRTFTMSDAKMAGLAGKSGPWSQYPARMLQMRARSWAMRDAFPDVLRGFQVGDQVGGQTVVVDAGPVAQTVTVEQLDEAPASTAMPPSDLGGLTAQMTEEDELEREARECEQAQAEMELE